MGIVIFNGISSQDLHIQVQTEPDYDFPEKDYEVTHVPGRNGDIVIDQGSWQNVSRKYNLAMDALKISYTEVASKLVQWLHSASGYARLEDSYEPDFYRMAMYKDSGSITNIYNKAGQIEVEFTCKPQRYFKSGEVADIFTASTEYRNPTDFPAKPLIKIHGSGPGTVKIGSCTVTINDIVDGMIVDSEQQDTYKDQMNCNSKVSILEYPKLEAGNNAITLSGGVTSIEIIPRWWTL
nr:MAG TPA: distal tail protein [Caudoviricetes sp.]